MFHDEIMQHNAIHLTPVRGSFQYSPDGCSFQYPLEGYKCLHRIFTHRKFILDFEAGVYTPQGGTKKSALPLRVLICSRFGILWQTPRTLKNSFVELPQTLQRCIMA